MAPEERSKLLGRTYWNNVLSTVSAAGIVGLVVLYTTLIKNQQSEIDILNNHDAAIHRIDSYIEKHNDAVEQHLQKHDAQIQDNQIDIIKLQIQKKDK